MTTNPYLDSGPHFNHGGSQDGEKPPPFSPAELQPQYVHQLAPNPDPLPPPELTHPIPHRKGVKQRCIKFTVAAVISLLLLLLVAGVLLGYYLSSTCVHGVACGDGSCVWESQWCDGVRDCPRGQDEAACYCGSGVNSSRALRGQPATLGSWPWQVSLQVEGSHRCGGAIITPYWILTAAHCVAGNSNPADWTVYAGIVDSLGALFNPAHSVSRIVAHEGYSSLTLRNDIALMKLSNPFHITAPRNIGPVCLPNVALNITAPQSCWISGFGGTENGVSPYLMEAEVSLTDSADCNSSIAYNGRITQDMLCAGATEGDSGGPLVSQRDGVWWLLGDSSWGDQCTVQNTPGVYGNVTYFLGWVYHQLGKYQD
ncbi:transmembrane protease serine 2-like [Centroberyx affinis]|uniref:transmembrane protease serine 2-like n=1 Tax=Centroberyx affinis TaxID=166261 RepID=UPI003A5C0D44